MKNKPGKPDLEKDVFEGSPKEAFAALTSGDLKMLSLTTILAVANMGLLIFMFFDAGEQEMFFPVHLKGKIVWVILSLTMVLWTVLVILNWKSWLAKRRGL